MKKTLTTLMSVAFASAVFSFVRAETIAVTGGEIAYEGATEAKTLPNGDVILVFTNVDSEGMFSIPANMSAKAHILAVGGGGAGGSTPREDEIGIGAAGGGGAGGVSDRELVLSNGVYTVEVGEGGKLGPDWVMPLGKFAPHPFSNEELKKVIGEPQFKDGAKLMVERVALNAPQKDSSGGLGTSRPTSQDAIHISIPLADGKPDSRVFAYEVEVVGDASEKRLFKSVYAIGRDLGIGHEPNGGVTTLEIPKSKLPEGKKLTIAVRPLSSLGTAGKAIATTWRV